MKGRWLWLLVTLVFVAIFAKLGLWQLDRAQEKIAIDEAATTAQQQSPLQTVSRVPAQSDIYRAVTLRGVFDPEKQFLLDNRIHLSQPGYEVLTLFYPDSTDTSEQKVGADRLAVLVNRGWIGNAGDRTSKPSVSMPVPAGEVVSLHGLLTVPSKGFTLGDAIDAGQHQWPVLLQYVDYETIASKLDKITLIEAVVVSAEGQNWNYAYNWQAVAGGPQKHYGYAFQWFAMLLAVIALFVYLNFIKKDE